MTEQETSFAGGIGSLVCEILADNGRLVPVHRFASQDRQFISYGSRSWFHTQNDIDPQSILDTLAALGHRK